MFDFRTRSSTPGQRRTAKPQLTPLEERLTLTASFNSATGLLTVVGTPQNDRIIVSYAPSTGRVNVQENGRSTASVRGVRQVLVLAGNGNDFVSVAAPIPVNLQGGDGNDVLYGGSGGDVLVGGNGNDGLYGGVGSDVLFGNAGADRFLTQTGDVVRDRTSVDARLTFVGNWTPGEIQAVDIGLAKLHARTADTRLLKLATRGILDANGTSLYFQRVATLGEEVFADNDSQGIIRLATFAFAAENQVEFPVWSTVIHEIGHNYDEPRENPFFNFARFNSLPGRVSDYAETDRYEDFAETLTATFFAVSPYNPRNAPGKVSMMTQWLNTI